MAVRVHNLANEFLAFWDAAEGKPYAERALLWETHYVRPHKDILDFYDQEYGPTNTPLTETFGRYPEVVADIRAAASNVEPVLKGAVEFCAELLAVPDAQTRHIVMVGRFGSNAWADVFQEVPTCFYALELMPDLPCLAVMAAHETTHILHLPLSGLPFDGKTVAETLHLEGLATLVSSRAAPGQEGEAYLWPGYRHTIDGQGVAAWLAECRTREGELKADLLGDLDRRDPAVMRRYFVASSERAHGRTPVRAGYAVGYWLVEGLAERFSVAELARWDGERMRGELAELLSRPRLL